MLCSLYPVYLGCLEGSIMECHPEGSLLPKARGWANSRTQTSCFYYTSDLAWMSEFTGTKLLVSAADMLMMSSATYMVTEHARNIVALLWRPSGPQSLVMLPAKMADCMMSPDKVTEVENSIYYHTSINQSEESISIRCIIILNTRRPHWKKNSTYHWYNLFVFEILHRTLWTLNFDISISPTK